MTTKMGGSCCNRIFFQADSGLMGLEYSG